MQTRRYLLRAASLLSGIALCSLLAGRGEPDTPEILPTSDSPLGAASRLLQSYRLGRLDEYAALLSPGYRFVFAETTYNAAQPDGFTREDEIASARHLFEGFTDGCGIRRPAARSIEISFDAMEVEDEPGRSDSAGQYQVVVAHDVRLRIELEDGTERIAGPDCHEFHFVRGDVAVCGPDQAADADHWYLWRWIELPACGAVAYARARTSPSPPVEVAARERDAPGHP
jgi:hypothetical protein